MIIIPYNKDKILYDIDEKKIKIFSFNEENLINEIDIVYQEEKQENDQQQDSENSKEIENSDGSDSEPSFDNFDNDELIKLLPRFSKKISKFFFYFFKKKRKKRKNSHTFFQKIKKKIRLMQKIKFQ